MADKKIDYNMVTIVTLFIGSMAIRLLYLFTERDFWHDESFTYLFSKESLTFISISNDVHPPLFYYITSIWQHISTNEIFLRSLSLIFFVMFFVMLYIYLDRYHAKTTTVMTLAFVSFSSTMVYYSTEYRNYMFGMFLVISQFYLFRRLIEKHDKRYYWSFVVISGLMLYTHYFTGFILLVEFVYIFFKDYRILKSYFLDAYINIGILSMPLMYYFYNTLPKMQSMWFEEIDFVSLISTISYQFVLPDTLSYMMAFLIVSSIIMLTYGLISTKVEKIYPFLFVIPVFFVWVMSQATPVYHHRFFLFYAFGLYITIAIIITNMIEHKSRWVSYTGILYFALILFLLVMSTTRLPESSQTELSEAQAILKQELNPDSHYVFIHNSPFSQSPMKYYFRDWNVENLLNTHLTKKERFTAGGSVIKDREIIHESREYDCYDGCIFFEEKNNNIVYPEKIYYDGGGLIVYKQEIKKNWRFL